MIIQVSSHRRSGTHALIDFIRNNFKVHDNFFHLEEILDRPIEKISELPLVVKTHEPEPEKKLRAFIKQGRVTEEKAQDIKDMTVDVHAYRYPKDVLKSLYYFNLKGHEPVYKIPESMSFLEFLKQEGVQDAAPSENRIQFWQRCTKNWVFNQTVLSLNYETIAAGNDKLIIALSHHLNLVPVCRDEVVDQHFKSTAIGRDTTKNMGGGALWSDDCEKFYQREIDSLLLKKLYVE